MAKRISKFLSALLVIGMIISMIPAVATAATASTLYLKPSTNWLEADARFAAYFFGNGEIWVDCVDTNGDGIYEVEVPAGYTKVIFCRMNPGTSINTWNYKWNQTSDLDIPTDANVQYTVEPGSWDNGNGIWGPFGSVCDHTYVFGVCTKCGDVDKSYVEEDWYLYGTINGVTYGETDVSDYRLYTTGEYNSFGMTFTVTKASYIAVKNASSTKWYLTNGWQGQANSVTLYDSTKLGENGDMLYLPTGKVTVTMQINNDATMTLSYTVSQTGVCTHPSHDQNGYCTVCHYDVEHTYVNGKCSVCGKVESGAVCSHNYVGQIEIPVGCLTDGLMIYTCSKCGDSYEEAIYYTGHSYNYGTCDKCGQADPNYSEPVAPAKDYYLFGYINGGNYGCEEDWNNLGEYKFVNGKLTATFTCDSYVAVKENLNANWYMFESFVDGNVGTLYNTNKGTSEKMFVPGGIELTFYLVENEDGSLTLSYFSGNIVAPNLTLSYPSLSFEDEILYNVYYSVDNTSSVVEMGLITFNSKLTNGTIADAVDVIPGFVNSGSTYMVQTHGIPAKNLGDALYFKVYAKLADGSYVYSAIAGYNAPAYAKSVLNNASSSTKAKALVVAMLNYGAAAQTYFGYNTGSLMNSILTADQKALVKDYSASMVADVVKATTAKSGSFVMNGGYSNIYPTVSFEGAFSINYYFTPNKTVDGTMTFYYWDSATYNSVNKLTAANATGVITMKQDGSDWGAAVQGIAAKSIDETIYVAAVYTSNGVSYPTNVIAYSLGQYCKTIAANGEAFGAATAVYGYYAKAFFA